MATLRRSCAVAAIVSLFALASCASPGDKTAIGAATGTALGAGLGAIIGSATGDAGPGIAIGAAAGALAGGLTGNALDSSDEEIEARREELARQDALIEENRRLIEELRRRGADARGSARGVVINLPDVLFNFDKFSLTGDARRTIQEIADVLEDEAKGRKIAVEGHTDSIGTMAYNQRLSERRADSVADALSRNGVSRNRLKIRGFGEGSPVATNSNDNGRARNRRVEVIIEN